MKERLLFVDDDPDLLQGLQRMLRSKRSEWDMTFANGSRQALELMNRTCFDVVVADMRMPEIDGAELLSETKKICPKSVRIILSGQADLSNIIASIKCTHQYLSKPCDPDTLKYSIERATNLQKLMKNSELAAFISQIEGLPSAPVLFDSIMSELSSDLPSIEKVSALVAKDVGISAKVLQMVNSCFFGSKKEVFSINEAVGILGIEILRKLVISSGIFYRSDSGFVGQLSLADLSQHSISVGNFAQRLAVVEGLEQSDAEICSTTGLLHDIGKIIMSLYDTNGYSEVIAYEAKNGHATEKEIELFGTTHCEVGAYLLGLWGLPSAIVDAASYHYGKGSKEFSVLTALQAADLLASANHPIGNDHLEKFIEIGAYKSLLTSA